MEKLLLREPEARAVLGGISRGAFFNLVREGRIRVLKLGKASYYEAGELRAFVKRLREAQAAVGGR